MVNILLIFMADKKVQKMITFPVALCEMVEKRAKKVGMLLPEYIRFLVLCDLKAEVDKIPLLDFSTDQKVAKSVEDYEKGDFVVIDPSKKAEMKKLLKKLEG